MKRLEDPGLLIGQGRYLDDIRLPGLLHAAFVRSPHAHARLVRLHIPHRRNIVRLRTVPVRCESPGIQRRDRRPVRSRIGRVKQLHGCHFARPGPLDLPVRLPLVPGHRSIRARHLQTAQNPVVCRRLCRYRRLVARVHHLDLEGRSDLVRHRGPCVIRRHCTARPGRRGPDVRVSRPSIQRVLQRHRVLERPGRRPLDIPRRINVPVHVAVRRVQRQLSGNLKRHVGIIGNIRVS